MALHILNLLVIERYTTSQKTTGTVQGELSEPLNDLVVEAEALKDAPMDPEMARHVERILRDVERIRKRVKSVSRGPQTLLGADEAEGPREIDPVLRGKRILVVDNEEDVATTIRDVLTRRGCAATRSIQSQANCRACPICSRRRVGRPRIAPCNSPIARHRRLQIWGHGVRSEEEGGWHVRPIPLRGER